METVMDVSLEMAEACLEEMEVENYWITGGLIGGPAASCGMQEPTKKAAHG
jgi:hypothetical protein